MNDLEVLVATERIRQLQARYARYADEKRWHDLAALFTTDATFTSLDADGKPLVEMTGREDIEAKLTAVGQGDVTLIHQLLTAEIDVQTPSTAKAVWAMADLIFQGDDPPAEADLPQFKVMRGWGHYHNDYRAVDGEWLISKSLQTRTRLVFE